MHIKDRLAETGRVEERIRARVERGAGDVPGEPGNAEQMADRHAVASGEEEKQHEENRMRDIQNWQKRIGGSKQKQPDRLRKTVRFEQEVPNTSSSSTCEW